METNQTNLIAISSVPAETIPANCMQVVSRWKSTDARPIAATNRVRAVILPKDIWQDAAIAAGVVSPAFNLFVVDAVEDLAKSYLSTIVEESNWMRATVNQDAFTLSALLSWQQERAAASGRLSGDAIKAWAEQSATITSFQEKAGKEKAAALVTKFTKLAGPNHGWTREQAERMLSTVFNTADLKDSTGLRISLKLTAIKDKEEITAQDLF